MISLRNKETDERHFINCIGESLDKIHGKDSSYNKDDYYIHRDVVKPHPDFGRMCMADGGAFYYLCYDGNDHRYTKPGWGWVGYKKNVIFLDTPQTIEIDGKTYDKAKVDKRLAGLQPIKEAE